MKVDSKYKGFIIASNIKGGSGMPKNINTTKSMNKSLSEKEMEEMTRITGEKLKNERKLAVAVPYTEGSGEKFIECGINGYNYIIKRGTTVELPQSLYDILKTAGVF